MSVANTKRIGKINFLYKILLSDENIFTNNELFDKKNLGYWGRDNPKLIRDDKFQERNGLFVVVCFCYQINRSHIFDGFLTGNRYNILLAKKKGFWMI